MTTLTLFRHPLSGHSHRVELLLSLLKLDATLVNVDLLAGEHKTAGFLDKNPAGQVPVLQDAEHTINDSNAQLVYLASRYDTNRTWLPVAAADQAEIQRFLTLAAGPVAFGPAAARLVTVFGAGLDHQVAIETAHKALASLEQHLAGRQWLVSHHPTIADVANYAYIAHAPEGNVDLSDYPNVRGWLQRIENLDGFVPMQNTAVGLAA